MSKSVVYVGLDVHKDSIEIAVAREGRKPAERWKTIPYDGVRLRKALKMLVKDGEVLKVCYEAGPTGFGLCRRLRKAGIDCIVVAPSLLPGRPGDRVKGGATVLAVLPVREPVEASLAGQREAH